LKFACGSSYTPLILAPLSAGRLIWTALYVRMAIGQCGDSDGPLPFASCWAS